VPESTSESKSAKELRAVEEIVTPVLRAHGVSLFDLVLRREQSGWVLRVVIEVTGSAELGAGVSVDMCADISRDLSSALDVTDPVRHAYALEVSSPGIERPLRTLEEHDRFKGRMAKVYLEHPLADGQRLLRGRLSGVVEDRVRVEVSEGKDVEVPFANVKRAHLIFEMPGQPKKNTTKQQKKRPANGR
jgi:ribosome maturation factor RimP